MAKGDDVAGMEIDQNSSATDQISNPKFSINGGSLSFCINHYVYVCVDECPNFGCEFRSAAAIEISTNAARIALQWLRSLQVVLTCVVWNSVYLYNVPIGGLLFSWEEGFEHFLYWSWCYNHSDMFNLSFQEVLHCTTEETV